MREGVFYCLQLLHDPMTAGHWRCCCWRCSGGGTLLRRQRGFRREVQHTPERCARHGRLGCQEPALRDWGRRLAPPPREEQPVCRTIHHLHPLPAASADPQAAHSGGPGLPAHVGTWRHHHVMQVPVSRSSCDAAGCQLLLLPRELIQRRGVLHTANVHGAHSVSTACNLRGSEHR